MPASTPWAEAPPLKIHPRLREYGEAAHACSANWLRKRCRSKLPATASQLATPRAFRIGATRAIVDGIETGRVVALPSNHAVDAIRVILGPQADHFSEEQIAAFLAGPWQVSARGDRMAYFLEGPRLSHALDYNIVSDGIAMGAIQVPGEGQPIVQMADRQPTGGYAKIATIIGPDLGRFAQMRAGAVIRFHRVEHAGAVAACAAQAAFLNGALAVEPLMRTRLTSEFLLGLNLVDGCVDALRQHRS